MKKLLFVCLMMFVGGYADAQVDGVKHLPHAPSWNYRTGGTVDYGAVGSDYCDLNTGESCDGANILISGAAARVIYNQLKVPAVKGVKSTPTIECTLNACLMHVTGTGVAAGETPWISD